MIDVNFFYSSRTIVNYNYYVTMIVTGLLKFNISSLVRLLFLKTCPFHVIF